MQAQDGGGGRVRGDVGGGEERTGVQNAHGPVRCFGRSFRSFCVRLSVYFPFHITRLIGRRSRRHHIRIRYILYTDEKGAIGNGYSYFPSSYRTHSIFLCDQGRLDWHTTAYLSIAQRA